ncbi:MAG: hypothetical protein CMJ83_09715 [Planctomycetes bacterium]|nr:hypothetical protein [Planctomycetota bacterium]
MNPTTRPLSLLQSATPDRVRTEPFDHAEFTPVFDTVAYQRFEDTFPPLARLTRGRADYGSNQAVRLAAKEVIADEGIDQIWRDFFAYHVSQDWWNDIVRVMGDGLRRAHPGLEERVGKSFEDWRAVRRGGPESGEVLLDCLFVMNTPVTKQSSVKVAHVDRSRKIFSGLFYCRDPRDAASGGDLGIHRLEPPFAFDKHQVPESCAPVVDTLRYTSNKFICFANSPVSVHSVTPRGVTAVPRRYVNIVVEVPFQAFKPPQMPWPRRYFYRLFRRHRTRNFK